MKGFVGVTDNGWFSFLATSAILYLQAAHSERNMMKGSSGLNDEEFTFSFGGLWIW